MTQVVLIVDDSEDNRCVLADALEAEGYELREAADGVEALAQVEREAPDLVLLDVMMPRMDGLECCRRLAENPATRHIPVLLVTALDADRHVIEGLDAARDYVAKPFAGAVVRARVRSALRAKLMHDEIAAQKAEIERLATALEAKNEELGALALHDGLTGLPNRLLFTDRLDQALARSRREPDHRIAVLYLDFDRFKQVNDTLGHAAGDQLLQSIAGRLRTELRCVDSITRPGAVPSRLGGDEFVILLEELRDPSDIEMIVARLQSALAAPYGIAGREVVCTASIGVVAGDNGYEEASAMIRDADAAMYHAKHVGRSCHAVFDASMKQASRRRAALEGQFRDALANGELTLHYQPMIRLEDGALAGVEALVRWPHPERGLQVFEDFSDAALASGVMADLGAFAVREACLAMRRWRERLGASAPPCVSVNLWERQLEAPAIVDDVVRSLADADLEPARLILEIPERVFVAGSETARRSLARLRASGVRVAMDNWGDGASGVALLHGLPIDVLKIDRAVIGMLEGEFGRSAVVHSVITLAHNLGVRVAAVGIEGGAQLAHLQALECDLGQGLHLGCPCPADEIGREARDAVARTGSAPRYAKETG